MHGICHFKTQINSLKITQAKGEIGKGKLMYVLNSAPCHK
jgi:hypothetical protein